MLAVNMYIDIYICARVCVYTYRHARLEKVKMMRWSLGRALPQHILEQLSAQEKDFFKEYDRCVMKYVSQSRTHACTHVRMRIHACQDEILLEHMTKTHATQRKRIGGCSPRLVPLQRR